MINHMKDTANTPQEESRELEALRRMMEIEGELFPTSEETVMAYEANMKPLPEGYSAVLPDPMQIIRRGRLPYLKVMENEVNEPGVSDFALAARKGKAELPAELLKKMRRQRDEDEANQPLNDQ
jgi:hypothetical protein